MHDFKLHMLDKQEALDDERQILLQSAANAIELTEIGRVRAAESASIEQVAHVFDLVRLGLLDRAQDVVFDIDNQLKMKLAIEFESHNHD